MDTATGTEPEDEGQDEDEDETDAPGSWHKQLPRGGYMRHKARVLGEADIGKWQEQSSLGWVKGQPASQPARTLKGTRLGPRMWTWHWTRRWGSLR